MSPHRAQAVDVRTWLSCEKLVVRDRVLIRALGANRVHRVLPLRLRRCVSAPVLVVAGDGPFRRGNGSDGLNTRPLSDNIAIPGAAFRTAQQLAEAMTGSRSGLSCEVGRRGKELNLLPLPCVGSALPMSYAPSESLSAAWRNPLGPRWGGAASQNQGVALLRAGPTVM